MEMWVEFLVLAEVGRHFIVDMQGSSEFVRPEALVFFISCTVDIHIYIYT